MKKIVLLFASVALVMFNLTAQVSCGVETFDNSNANSSYADNSFVGDNAVTWTYVESRDENGDSNNAGISGNALMLRRVADGSKVTSSAVSGGIGDFSVKLYKGFTGGGDRQVELFVNGVSKGTSTAFDDNLEHDFTVTGINVAGNVVIELRNITSKQIIVDSIAWTCYTAAAGTPMITVTNTNLTGFTYQEGSGPSNVLIDTLSATDLNGTVYATNVVSFEFSYDGTTWVSDIDSIVPVLGNIPSSPIFVRLIAGLSAGTYNETMTLSSTGATSVVVNLSGEVTAPPLTACSELLISEYVEDGGEKYLEIYNPIDSTVDLTNYDVVIYSNGSTSVGNTISLTGSLSSGGVYVIKGSGSSDWSGTADLSTGSLSFNGNDAVALRHSSNIIDVVGVIGNSSYFGDDRTLSRLTSVEVPTTTYDVAEWTDTTPFTTAGLGTHVTACVTIVCNIPITTIPTMLCANDSLVLSNNTVIKTAGLFNDTLVGTNNCDSVLTYDVTMLMTSSSTQDSAICEGETVMFGGMTLDTTGIYADTLVSANGCDSIVTLNLTVNMVSTNSIDVEFCNGDSFTLPISGVIATMTNAYLDTTMNAVGCDSIVTYNVTVLMPSVSTQDTTICDGETVMFGGMTLDTTGMYTDTLISANGCDSIVTLNLSVSMTSVDSLDMAICQGDTVTLDGGTMVSAAGFYDELFTSIVGCDSLVTTNVIVNMPTTSTENVHLCDGDSLVLSNGIAVTTANTYMDTTVNSIGCDSVISYQVTTGMSTTTILDTAICQGETVTLSNGTVVSTAGSYDEVLMSASGCDSTFTTNVTVNAISASNMDVNICQGDSFVLPISGVVATTAGAYMDTTANSLGCDSVITYQVMVGMHNSSIQDLIVCQGETITLDGGTMVSTAGTYVEVFTNVSGCDSTVTSNVTLSNPTTSTQDIHLCDGATFTLPLSGLVITTANTYLETTVNSVGCDSVISYNVTTGVSTSSNVNIAFCAGETVMLADGSTVAAAGTQMVTITNVSGCDSVITYTINENVVPMTSISETICENDTFMFDGQSLVAAGVYNMVVSNGAANGCDSLVELTLTVNVATSSTMNASICEGDAYLFNGMSLTDAGTYDQLLTNVAGCDSLVTLVLTVNAASAIDTLEETICEGASYQLFGQTLTMAGTYTETGLNVAGCDSTVTVVLTVQANEKMEASICEGSEYVFGTQTLTTAGVYTEMFTTDSGCDYEVELTLSVYNSVSTTEEVLLCNDQLEYELANGTVVTEAGIYTAFLTTVNGCDSMITYNVSTCVGIFDIANNVVMTVYPNPTKDVLNIKFAEKLTTENNLTIVNVLGQEVYAENNIDESSLLIDASTFTSGIYYVQVTSDNKVSVKSFTVAK